MKHGNFEKRDKSYLLLIMVHAYVQISAYHIIADFIRTLLYSVGFFFNVLLMLDLGPFMVKT